VKKAVQGAIQRGGAILALPLLLWAAALPAATLDDSRIKGAKDPGEAPHLDAGALYLSVKPEVLDEVPQALGFPATGGSFTLLGGGASFSKGPLRVGVQAYTGDVSHRDRWLNTEWRLNLYQLVLEQVYPHDTFIMTAGTTFSLARIQGLLEDGSALTRFEGGVLGGGAVAGIRWPRQSRLGFMARGGYLWLPVQGQWKGALAGSAGKSAFDIGGPMAQAQAELSF
jgi:hypothetical protein